MLKIDEDAGIKPPEATFRDEDEDLGVEGPNHDPQESYLNELMNNKEKDLKQKLFMKQSLKKIRDGHQMGLLENFEGYTRAVK